MLLMQCCKLCCVLWHMLQDGSASWKVVGAGLLQGDRTSLPAQHTSAWHSLHLHGVTQRVAGCTFCVDKAWFICTFVLQQTDNDAARATAGVLHEQPLHTTQALHWQWTAPTRDRVHT